MNVSSIIPRLHHLSHVVHFIWNHMILHPIHLWHFRLLLCVMHVPIKHAILVIRLSLWFCISILRLYLIIIHSIIADWKSSLRLWTVVAASVHLNG